MQKRILSGPSLPVSGSDVPYGSAVPPRTSGARFGRVVRDSGSGAWFGSWIEFEFVIRARAS